MKQRRTTPLSEVSCEYLTELYINQNLCRREIGVILSCCISSVTKLLKKFNIKKSKEQLVAKCSQTYFERTGYTNCSKNPEVKERRKHTNLERFGQDNYLKTEECKTRVANTNLERYGCVNVSSNDDIKRRRASTNLTRYNGVAPACSQGVKDKIIATNQSKYNGNAPMCSDEVKQKAVNTNLNRYGTRHPNQCERIKRKIRETTITNQRKGKNMSKLEKTIRELLNIKFGENDVIYQYYDSKAYPFNCDFYVKSLKLFIEIQGYPGHHTCPYDPTNAKHLELVETWKRKGEEARKSGKVKNKYFSFVETWTVSDPKKRQCAKDNNLNWVEFFNLAEFTMWLLKV